MNELIAACPLVIGVLIRIWGVAPAPIEAGMAVAWGAWHTRLLESVDPSVAYPFDMVVRKSFGGGGYVDCPKIN